MRSTAAILVLVAVSLAGCTGAESTDFSKQSLTISFLDLGQGFSVVVPLWLSDGTDPAAWLDAFLVIGNATISIVDTERGPGLRIDGEDNIRLDAQDVINRDKPRAFTEGETSLGAVGQRAWAQVLAGDVDITQWHYEGHSDGCFVTVTQFWSNFQEGWQIADANSRRSDPAYDCL